VIANEIQKATGSPNVGVYLQATHGCCENRGIGAHSSLTQTTVLRGAFGEDPGTKKSSWTILNYNKSLLVTRGRKL
jgi:GTP cyclohydrolase I